MTIQELGQTAKQKYPAYQSVDDATLGQKILAKYPEYQHLIHQSPFNPVQQPGTQSQFIDPNKSQPGTTTASKFMGQLVPQVGQMGVDIAKPFAKTGVSLYNAGAAAKDLIKSGGKPSKQATQDLNQPRNLPGFLGGQTKPFSSKPMRGTMEAAGAGFDMAATVEGGLKPLAGMARRGFTTMAEKSALKEAANLTAEKVTAGKALGILKKGGAKSMEVAQSIIKDGKSLITKGASVEQNFNNVMGEIGRISEQEIKPALANVKQIFNPNQIKGALMKLEPPDLIKTDESLIKTYDLVRQRMVEAVSKEAGTAQGLWDASIKFDQTVKQQFGDAIFNSEKNSAVKAAVRDMRNTVRGIIGKAAPEFQPQMDKLHNMYTGIENYVENNYKMIGKGAIQRFIKNHPYFSGAVGLGAAEQTIQHGLGFAKKLIGL